MTHIFKKDLIKENTGGKLYKKMPSWILLNNVGLFLPQCTNQKQVSIFSLDMK